MDISSSKKITSWENNDGQVIHTKYVELPDIISSWVDQQIDLASADILDFGCGEGVTALGFASRLNANSVVGVDIMPDPQYCRERAQQYLGMETLPSNLELRQINPGEDFFPNRKFDLIYSWSVFEHVEQSMLSSVLNQLKARLKPNGLLFIQIAPLYYSAEGSHLFHKIPEPWGHLSNQDSVYYAKLCSSCESKYEIDTLWSCYQTLNRLTADGLIELLESSGLHIIRKYFTQESHYLPDNLSRVYKKEVLLTNQIVVLANG